MANEHNTVTWTGHTLTASDGKDYNIVAGTTTDDIPSRMVDGTLYYIYWDQKTPHQYGTIIASGWATKTPSGKHVISEVTGQSSTAHAGTVKANVEYKTDVPATTKVNVTAIGQQDSITAATVSNIGTSVSTGGPRFKFNFPGTDSSGADSGSGGSDANRHWIRGFTAASVADTGGRWLDIDGYDKSLTIRSGTESDRRQIRMDEDGLSVYDGDNDYLLAQFGKPVSWTSSTGTDDTAGIRFFNGTATAASDARAITHIHAGGIRFYNSSGMGADVETNLLMDIQANNIRFFNTNANILMRVSATGLTYYDGTAAAPADGETVSEQTSTLLTYYNASGKGTANKRVEIGMGAGQSLATYAAGNFNTFNGSNTSDIAFYSSLPQTTTTWNEQAKLGLWRWAYDGSTDANNRDSFVISSPTNVIIASHAGVSNNGAVVDIAADASGQLSGWRFHSSSDSGNVFRNFLYPFNADRATNPDGTAGEPFNYIGYNYPDTSTPTYLNGTGTWSYASPYILSIYSYFHVGGVASSANPTYSFVGETDCGMYRHTTGTVGFAADGGPVMTLAKTAADKTTLVFPGDLSSTSSASGLQDVQINGSYQLLRYTSSARYKENIRDLEVDTSNIYNLRPVTYNAITEKGIEDFKSFGLIAEEVNKIYPELVSYNEKGQPEAVSYSRLPVFLLSELKKIRKELDELKEAN